MYNVGVQVEGDFKINWMLLIILVLISIVVGCVMGWYIVCFIIWLFDEVVCFVEVIVDGDLICYIIIDYKDEIGVLL